MQPYVIRKFLYALGAIVGALLVVFGKASPEQADQIFSSFQGLSETFAQALLPALLALASYKTTPTSDWKDNIQQ